MARTKLDLKTVRVPVKLSRALAVKAKFDDLDDFLDAVKLTAYTAAGAISPTDGVAFIDSAVALQAMTLGNPSPAIDGQVLSVIFRAKTGSGTVRITPTSLNGGTTWTLSTAGQRGQLIWQTSDNKWHLRAGFGGVLA